MHKGIRITIHLMIEGEDEPTHDFARSSLRAVQEILAAGQGAHPELKVTVQKVEEDKSSDDDDN